MNTTLLCACSPVGIGDAVINNIHKNICLHGIDILSGETDMRKIHHDVVHWYLKGAIQEQNVWLFGTYLII